MRIQKKIVEKKRNIVGITCQSNNIQICEKKLSFKNLGKSVWNLFMFLDSLNMSALYIYSYNVVLLT